MWVRSLPMKSTSEISLSRPHPTHPCPPAPALSLHPESCKRSLILWLEWEVANLVFLCWHQVTKLIEECGATKISRIAIHPDKILDWLVEHHILSVALEGMHFCLCRLLWCLMCLQAVIILILDSPIRVLGTIRISPFVSLKHTISSNGGWKPPHVVQVCPVTTGVVFCALFYSTLYLPDVSVFVISAYLTMDKNQFFIVYGLCCVGV